MPLKTSSLNKELLMKIARNVCWLSVIYFLGLLFALPFRISNQYNELIRYRAMKEEIHSLFYFDFLIQNVLMVTIPILVAVFLFRFLHVRNAADMMHSMPLKRQTLFHYHVLTGFMFLVLPVLFISLILLVLYGAMDLELLFPMKYIVTWAGYTILFNTLFYMVGVFIAMLTGISVFHAILTYILLILPTGLALLIVENLRLLQYGFPSDYLITSNLETLSPLLSAFMMDDKGISLRAIVIFAIIPVILYGLSLYLYQKRKTEVASEAIAFKSIQYVFKYGATLCAMLLCGIYFSEIQNSATGWTVFGYVAGAALGYFISEMILRKTWRVSRTYKGLLGYGLIIAALISVLNITGLYEKNIPVASEVDEVLFTDNLDYVMGYYSEDQEVFPPSPVKGKELIEQITKLHNQIVKDKKINLENNNDETVTLFFKYKLKDGSKVIRSYSVNERLYEDMLKPVQSSVEYKLATNAVFKYSPKKINRLEIGHYYPVGNSLMITNKEDISSAFKALKKDILEESYEEGKYFSNRGFHVNVVLKKENSLDVEFKPSYRHFQKWIQEKGMGNIGTVNTKDVAYIIIGDKKIVDYEMEKQVEEKLNKVGSSVKIKDKELIDLALKNASGLAQRYTAVVTYKGGIYQEVLYFDGAHLPNEIKDKMKK
ncbi:hypothetical protein [Bacillus massilinigeriensis]|uniref:hypothetical protein n=1 Tax=Bacillus mediterraneensis TaxID=1805474 RepID=UPI0008F92FC8|nr:hypothetical protein [Bacillus mediterraneensis]